MSSGHPLARHPPPATRHPCQEPFSILPLEAFCNGAIAATSEEMLGAVQSGVFAHPTRDEEENVAPGPSY